MAEIVKADPPTPLVLIQAAIDKGLTPEQLGKLFDLQERFERARAVAAFNRSFAAAQAKMPRVVKDKVNKFLGANYVSLEELLEKITPIYTAEGFGMSFTEEECKTPHLLRYRCKLSHAEGHSEHYVGEFPFDGAGAQGGRSGMNPLQARGSTRTYGRRYLACDVWNLAIAEQDTDGQTGDGPATTAQIQEVLSAIAGCKAAGGKFDLPKFLQWLQIEDLEHLPAAEVPKVMAELRERTRKAKEARK